MPELGTYGSVRGAPSDGRPYRDWERTSPLDLIAPILYKRLDRPL